MGKVYPRVCGGTHVVIHPWDVEAGLSPRVRGNLASAPRFVLPVGSIPACAGEPHPPIDARNDVAVYPRVCGGTQSVLTHYLPPIGLSPRVRGNRLNLLPNTYPVRSIPACAGEPIPDSLNQSKTGVYPRVCGGTDATALDNAWFVGLSPRVRGNRIHQRARLLDVRSIPACAGEPATSAIFPQAETVYPRVCGGTEDASVYVGGRQRSIPACAGEPWRGGRQ